MGEESDSERLRFLTWSPRANNWEAGKQVVYLSPELAPTSNYCGSQQGKQMVNSGLDPVNTHPAPDF